MTQSIALPLAQRPALRQFVKFCIIGATSTVIDVGILKYLTAHWNIYWVLAQIASFVVAVTNGFVWNSLWTFRGLGTGPRHHQYAKFVAVNIVGLALNIIIMKAVMILLSGELIHHGNPPQSHLNVAKAAAVVCVAGWNFFANKKWTFV